MVSDVRPSYDTQKTSADSMFLSTSARSILFVGHFFVMTAFSTGIAVAAVIRLNILLGVLLLVLL